MQETDGLEPQQYERHYFEDDAPLNDVRKSALRKSVYIGALLFVIIVIAGSLIKFPDEVSLSFVLREGTPERIYCFPFPVYIEEQFDSPGSEIKKGESLVRITSPEIVTLINNYRQAEDALENYKLHKTLSVADTRAMVRLQAAQNTNRLQEITQRQAALESTWKSNEKRLRFELEDANKRLTQTEALYKSHDISAQELRTYETAQLRAADALNTATETYLRDANALREEAARYRLQNSSLNREEERNISDANTDSSALISNVAIAHDAIQHSFGDFEIVAGSLILKAEEDGILSFIFTGEREVPETAILLKIQKRSSGIYASAISPPTLIGKLQKGQIAYLKVATFPAYEWGTAKGHVEYMSLAPDEKGVFNIKLVLDEQRLLANRLQAGMTGTVSIQLDEKTFFQYFSRNLKKIKYKLEEG